VNESMIIGPLCCLGAFVCTALFYSAIALSGRISRQEERDQGTIDF
jgi:hypothetical protein